MDTLDEPVDEPEVEKPEEENADLEQLRDNYLDYYLGNAEEDFDDDFYDRTKKGSLKLRLSLLTGQPKAKQIRKQINQLRPQQLCSPKKRI